MTIKRPNKALYCIGFVVAYPLLKILFSLKIDRSNYHPQKGSFIILSNHQSYLDFLLPTLAAFPRRLNAVAAQKFFLYKSLNRLLAMMGCIPKSLFDSDVRTIKGVLTVLKRGDNILMFPEGRCSVAGDYMGMQRATGKLIKKAGVPVISCRIEGAYTCMPFWRKGFRAGQVRLTLTNLFSAEDTKALSADEINCAIDQSLGGEIAARTESLHTLRARKLAEGLHNILYYCVKCGNEFTLETKGNTIRCTSCGNTASLDRYTRFIPDEGSVAPETIQDWQREQNLHELQNLSEDMEPLTVDVTVLMPTDTPGAGVEPKGEGVLSLTLEGWRFEGELSGEPASVFIPLERVPATPFDPNDDFQIYHNGTLYMFRPTNACACAKYATIAECAYWRFMPDPQMTPGKNNGLNTA
jgi:1-acyl-sn-glycerol-3-phosphate acyltransferase